jgi:hypothetical protein
VRERVELWRRAALLGRAGHRRRTGREEAGGGRARGPSWHQRDVGLGRAGTRRPSATRQGEVPAAASRGAGRGGSPPVGRARPRRGGDARERHGEEEVRAAGKRGKKNEPFLCNQWKWWVISPNSRKLGFGGVPLEALHGNHVVGGLLHLFS